MIKLSGWFWFIMVFAIAIATVKPAFAQPDAKKKADSVRTKIATNPQSDSVKVTDLLNLGYMVVSEDPASSMKYTEQALAIALSINYKHGILASYRQKGLILYYQSDYLNSIDYSLKALRLADAEKDLKTRLTIINNLANVYADTKNYQKALQYYTEFYKGAVQLNATDEKIVATGNLGDIYVDLKNYPAAIRYLQICLQLSRQRHYVYGEASSLNNLGVIYSKQKNYPLAKSYLSQALQLAKQSNSTYIVASCSIETAKIYLSTQDYPAAIAYADSALSAAKAVNSMDWQAESYEVLSKAYEAKNMAPQAYAAYKNSVMFKDSMMNADKKAEIARKETQYEADKKQILAQEEIRNQKRIKETVITGTAILLVFIIVIFVLYKMRMDSVQVQKELAYKAEAAETEMKVLRLQLNPHFIFNSLNSISNYISKNDIKSADYFLAKFARLMRGTLENSEEKEVALADELKMIALYMQLEAARMNHKFTYNITVAGDLDTATTLVPPLILQPFVENSIWHGFNQKDGAGHITIDISRVGALLNCVITDDGVGRQAAAKSGKKSFGLKITSDRIALLNKSRHTGTGVFITDLETGTRVEIKLPFETES